MNTHCKQMSAVFIEKQYLYLPVVEVEADHPIIGGIQE